MLCLLQKTPASTARPESSARPVADATSTTSATTAGISKPGVETTEEVIRVVCRSDLECYRVI